MSLLTAIVESPSVIHCTPFTHHSPPLDILRRICSFLEDSKDVVHFGLVNRRLTVLLLDAEVWNALLQIPVGSLKSYLEIANEIGDPKASRAVGTAIGNNPIAYLIPCHRVITSSGNLGGYHWGIDRKSAIIGWEAAKESVRV